MNEPTPHREPDEPADDEGRRDGTRLSSGIEGLDRVLGGGFFPGYHYLVRGTPGAGKTVLGWHFLVADGGSDALYVTFEERPEKIRQNAASLGVSLDDVTILDMSPDARSLTEDGSYDVFVPSAVEYDALAERIRTQVESEPPRRVLLDPVTQLRYLAPDEYQFRRELLSLMDLLTEQGATVLFTSQASPETPDNDMQFMSDGIIELSRPHGGRVLEVPKFRGAEVAVGPHAVRLDHGGMSVYPRVVPDHGARPFVRRPMSSGVPALDTLLHGGIELGTTTLLSGPTGVGKTTVGALFVVEAAKQGHHAILYHLEEKPETFLARCDSIGIPASEFVEIGTLDVVGVTPSLLTVGEFLARVQRDITDDTTFVMIDGVQGFEKLSNLSEEHEELSALRSHLTARDITVLLTDEMPNITGEFRPTKSGETAIADNIVFMRYIEFNSEIHRAIGVLKKRTSDFEHRLRRFELTAQGVVVGDPLTGLAGLLTGDPQWVGNDPEREEVL